MSDTPDETGRDPAPNRALPAGVGSAVTANPLDAYPPAQMARLVEQVGVKKATLPTLQTLVLGLLAGVFIAFGAMYFTLAMTGSAALGFGPARLLGGVAFSLGLILVVVAARNCSPATA